MLCSFSFLRLPLNFSPGVPTNPRARADITAHVYSLVTSCYPGSYYTCDVARAVPIKPLRLDFAAIHKLWKELFFVRFSSSVRRSSTCQLAWPATSKLPAKAARGDPPPTTPPRLWRASVSVKRQLPPSFIPRVVLRAVFLGKRYSRRNVLGFA